MTRRQTTIVLLCVLGVLYVHLLVRSYNKQILPISYPEEITLITPGERLICESKSDSIYLGFDNKYTNPIEAEYLINLEDTYKTIIYAVDNDTLYVCKPNEIQQTIDFNEQ